MFGFMPFGSKFELTQVFLALVLGDNIGLAIIVLVTLVQRPISGMDKLNCDQDLVSVAPHVDCRYRDIFVL